MRISSVYVENFEGKDDAERIRAAIAHAAETGAETVVFAPRRYVLESFVTIRTEGFDHDANSAGTDGKACHIAIRGVRHLRLQGAADERGEPATVLVGFNDARTNGYLPAILWCEDNEGLDVCNLAFTREPAYASAGRVVYRDERAIEVEVFEGNPCYEGMGTYCMNRLDPHTGALLGESVTYGGGADAQWRLIAPRTLRLDSGTVAAKVNAGEWLSWHQGAQTDFQLYFARCDRLALSNLRTFNANGFAMLTESCRDIRADRVVFRPDGRRLFTAPRDAWKIFKCGGAIEISRMVVEGVRMDGQNMHSNWLFLERIENEREAVFFCRYTFAPLRTGSAVDLYEGEEAVRLTIAAWRHEGKGERGHYYRMTFREQLPKTAANGSLAAAACWEPDRYLCQDSEFVNIAGAGHLVRFDHLYIIGCTYRNTMNSGILLGAELPVHAEGGHATDIVIKGNVFDNCGFFPRYGASGCIGIKSTGFSGKYNRQIYIIDNIMRCSERGIDVIDGHDVWVVNNTFENVGTPLAIDEKVNGTVYERGNRIRDSVE